MTLFNNDNTEWSTGAGELILGEAPALFDSINTRHPELFNLYKHQKSIDWSEDELSLEQSRLDLLSCPKNIYDIMLLNIAYQWETDSVAARAIAPLLAPFITNSEYWAGILKISEIEVTHTLTYSEIVRQCVPDPNEVFKLVMHNEKIGARLEPVLYYFEQLRIAGAEYILGIRKNDQELYNIVYMAICALYCLERIQFNSSFAATFAIVEQGWFIAIGQLIQKIMQDEIGIHAAFGRAVLNIMHNTPRGKIAKQQCSHLIEKLIDDVLAADAEWNPSLFENGRSIVGLNPTLLNQYSYYGSIPVRQTFGLPYSPMENPLKYMDRWLDLNAHQHAQQESSSSNYVLNSVVDDISDLDKFII